MLVRICDAKPNNSRPRPGNWNARRSKTFSTRRRALRGTTTIDELVFGERQFDWVVVDEACQCTESACWIPLARAQRILLAGDHCQLPPTVISSEAAREGYAQSMMQRLVEHYGSAITRQLNVQYRMHENIMRFSSAQFYGDTLLADDSARGHLLSDLPDVISSPLTDEPLTFIDTACADYDEESDPDGASRRNPSEGRLVLEKVRQLVEAGDHPLTSR